MLVGLWIVAQLRTVGRRGVPELNLDEMEGSWNVWAKTPKQCPPHGTHTEVGAEQHQQWWWHWIGLFLCAKREEQDDFFSLSVLLKANLYFAPPPGPKDSVVKNAGYLRDDFPGPSPWVSHKVPSTCIKHLFSPKDYWVGPNFLSQVYSVPHHYSMI